MDVDPAAALSHLRAVDPVLATLVDTHGALDLAPRGQVYPALVRAILYQQLAGKAAATIERRFLDLFGGATPEPAALLAAEPETLRAAGVSRQKAAYLRDLAAHAAAGRVGEHLRALPDARAAAAVMAVKGVGRWTADMLLLFCLGRPDVLPVGDFGIRRAMRLHYKLPEPPGPAEMEQIAAPWRPYRAVACRYLWRSLDAPVPTGQPRDSLA